MRQRVANKLRERGGVTILMALFAMLVASVVCIVILGAAVTSVKQAKAQQIHEQNTLALQSAAELVRSEIAKGGEITLTGTPTESGGVRYSYDNSNTATGISGPMKSLTEMALSMAGPSSAFDVTASADEGGYEEYEQKVAVEFVLRPYSDPNSSITPEPISTAVGNLIEAGADVDCQLVVTLSTTGPEGQEGDAQYLFLKYSHSICKIAFHQEVTENGVVISPKYYTARFIWNSSNFYLAEDGSADE